MFAEEKKVEIFHICADYPYNRLYDLLISNLLKKSANSVYVPSGQRDSQASYPVAYLGRGFNRFDKILFFRKQGVIVNDVISRGLCKNANLIHAHTLFTSGHTAWKLSKEYKIPYIVAVRNADVNVFYRYMMHLRPIGIKILLDAKAVIFISPAYKKQVLDFIIPEKYKREIEEKSHVIPNGIDQFFLDNCYTRPVRRLEEKQIRLLYIGEVNANKNVLTTLKACDYLATKGYKPTLTIVGRVSNPRLEYIKNNKYVEYHPQSPKEEIIQYYRQNDIFVMPSLNETFGLVYVEALSQGMPIVYSKGQGVDGYFDEGSVGYHVESTNAIDIANAIIKILTDYNSISQRCVKAANPFSWRRIAEVYQSLYESIVK